jgi:5-methylcytosine-specific restriction endonuclease McrA
MMTEEQRAKNREATRKWRANCSHEQREQALAYGREYMRRRRAEGTISPPPPEKQREYSARWKANSKDALTAYWKRRWAEHREEEQQRNARRARARRVKLTTPMSERQAGLCYYCFEPLGNEFHVDHFIPVASGGTDDPENLVAACPACNLSKNDKHPHEFFAIKEREVFSLCGWSEVIERGSFGSPVSLTPGKEVSHA